MKELSSTYSCFGRDSSLASEWGCVESISKRWGRLLKDLRVLRKLKIVIISAVGRICHTIIVSIVTFVVLYTMTLGATYMSIGLHCDDRGIDKEKPGRMKKPTYE